MRRLAPFHVLPCLAAVSALACSGSRPPAEPTVGPAKMSHEADAGVDSGPATTTAKSAPVVVALVIDQFSAWVAEERVPELAKDGFFARMLREGTWAKRMRYPYAITDTAPGHAALHSGRTPNESHILVNETPNDKTGIRTSYFRDAATRLIAPSGVREELGSTPKPLAVPTIADRLRDKHPRAKVVSVSLKDRAALLPAGQHPDHAIWFDPDVDSFVTSSAVATAYPAWAKPMADNAAVKKARAGGWNLLDRDWVATHAGVKDDAPGEGDLFGMGITFPHRVPTSRSFRASPLPDPIILDIALAGVRAERDPNEPFLLLVSLSPSDVIGHTFGVNSWEAWDQLRRVDVELARFLRELEAMVGPVSLLLSGDHGNSSMPEARPGCAPGETRLKDDPYDRPCGGGGRLMPDVIREQLREETKRAFGTPDSIAGVSDGYVFLSAQGRAFDARKRARVKGMLERVLNDKHKGMVEAVYDVNELAEKCPAALAEAVAIPKRALPNAEPLFTLVCRSWAPNAGGGEFYIVPAHGSYFDGEIVPGKGGSHGTPWLYDRTVPLFLRGPGIEAGVAFTDPVDFTAYSAIEAAFIGLDGEPAGKVLDAKRAR